MIVDMDKPLYIGNCYPWPVRHPITVKEKGGGTLADESQCTQASSSAFLAQQHSQ